MRSNPSFRLWIGAGVALLAIGGGGLFAQSRVVHQPEVRTAPFRHGPSVKTQQFRPTYRQGTRRQQEIQPERYEERRHRQGFEVVSGRFIVLAATSMDDARYVAAEAAAAWASVEQLAGNFSDFDQQRTYPVQSVYLRVDTLPEDSKYRPADTLTVVNSTPVVYLNVGEDQPELEEQRRLLHEATARAFFHNTQLDLKLPPAVIGQLASYAAERSTETPADEQAATAARFYLDGADGEHAPAYFSALEEAIEQSDVRIAGADLNNGRRQIEPPETSAPLVELAEQTAADFAVWRENPLALEPGFEPVETSDPQLRSLQQEMLVVLKLAQRVQKFKPGNGPKIVGPEGVVAEPSRQPTDMFDLYRRLTRSGGQQWATRDADGSLLYSTDSDRLAQLIAPQEGRFQTEVREDRWELVSSLPDGRQIRAWMEEVEEGPRRKVAKFEMVKAKQ